MAGISANTAHREQFESMQCRTGSSENDAAMTDTRSVSRSVKSETLYQRRHRQRGQTHRNQAHRSGGIESRDDMNMSLDEREPSSESRDAATISQLPRPKSRKEWVVDTPRPSRLSPSNPSSEAPGNLFKESTAKLNVLSPAKEKQPRKKIAEDEHSAKTSISISRSLASKPPATKRTSGSISKNATASGASVKSAMSNRSLPAFIVKKTPKSVATAEVVYNRSKSDCNASRKTGVTSISTPRVSNVTKSDRNKIADKQQSFDDNDVSSLQKALLKSRTKSRDSLDSEKKPSEKEDVSKPASSLREIPLSKSVSFKSASSKSASSKSNRKSNPKDTKCEPLSDSMIREDWMKGRDASCNESIQSSASTRKKYGIRKILRLKPSNNSVISGVTGLTGWQSKLDEVDEASDECIAPPLDVEFVPKGSRKISSASKLSTRSKSSLTSSIPENDLEYWSGLSVRAAMAVMQAKGSEAVAQKAANAVLEAAKTKRKDGESKQHVLRTLATKASVAVLEAGGDHKVAAAVAVAIMNDGNDSVSRADVSDRACNVSGRKRESTPGGKAAKGKSRERKYFEEIDENGSGLSSDKYSVAAEEDVEFLNKAPVPMQSSTNNQSYPNAAHNEDNTCRRLGGRERSGARSFATEGYGKEPVHQADSGRHLPHIMEGAEGAQIIRDNSIQPFHGRSLIDEAIIESEESSLPPYTRERGKGHLPVGDEMTGAADRDALLRENSKEQPTTQNLMHSKSNHSLRNRQQGEFEVKANASSTPSAYREHDGVTPSFMAKRMLLREKEGLLEEAERLNIQREKELDERMAALDAATAALMDRANNVQQAIEWQAALKQNGEMAKFNGDQCSQNRFNSSMDECHLQEEIDRQVARTQNVATTKYGGQGFQNGFNGQMDEFPESSFDYSYASYYKNPNDAIRLTAKPQTQNKQITEPSDTKDAFVDDTFSNRLFRMLDFACAGSHGPSANISLTTMMKQENEKKTNKMNANNIYERDADYTPSNNYEHDANVTNNRRLISPTVSGLTEDQTALGSQIHNRMSPYNRKTDTMSPVVETDNEAGKPNQPKDKELNRSLLNDAMNQLSSQIAYAPKQDSPAAKEKAKKPSMFGKMKSGFKSMYKKKAPRKSPDATNPTQKGASFSTQPRTAADTKQEKKTHLKNIFSNKHKAENVKSQRGLKLRFTRKKNEKRPSTSKPLILETWMEKGISRNKMEHAGLTWDSKRGALVEC